MSDYSIWALSVSGPLSPLGILKGNFGVELSGHKLFDVCLNLRDKGA
jgi:hypothetical protein